MIPRAATLEAAGLRPAAAARRAAMFRQAIVTLGGDSSVLPPIAFVVPGRIEVLGKHTDYCGGRSLLCAVEQGFCFVARPRHDRRVRVFEVGGREDAECELSPDQVARRGHWTNYPATVVRRVVRNFPSASTGVDIAFSSDLPSASGMSSSSALMIGVFLALAVANGLERTAEFTGDIADRERLAGYLATIENGRTFGALAGDAGVGTFGGSEDHTAILCCRPGTLSQYRFAPVVHERDVAMPDDHVFIVAFSGVVASKTGAALEIYNRASRSASRVLDLWRSASGREDATLEAAVAASPTAADAIRRALAVADDTEFSPTYLRARFDQFERESRHIIPAAADALRAGDLARFGELVDLSQRGVEDWLGNQVPETIDSARSARELGAVAASSFGAGFGGSVWALVPDDRAAPFMAAWSSRYKALFPAAGRRASFFQTRPGPPATRLDHPTETSTRS